MFLDLLVGKLFIVRGETISFDFTGPPIDCLCCWTRLVPNLNLWNTGIPEACRDK